MVIVLGQNIGDQSRVKVAARHGSGRWQRGKYGLAIGGLVTAAAIEDIVRRDLEALHEGLLVVLEGRASGELCRVEDNGLVDGQSFGFGPSLLWRNLLTQAGVWPSTWRPWLFERAGLDLGSCLESLEACDFVLELLDEFQEESDKFE